jgi:hypothetical protein
LAAANSDAMATYNELREALRHIGDVYRDQNAWQRGLSAQDIADINGFLQAETSHAHVVGYEPGAGGHSTGVTGWLDPVSHKAYPYHLESTGSAPQVPDALIGALRTHFPGLFDPSGKVVTPVEPLPPLPGPSAPVVPGPPPKPAGLPTAEQQSGRTADAVRKLQDEVKRHYTELNSAEEQLSEGLLTAHAATTDGQHKLNEIQNKLVEAVNDPFSALDTPSGETQFLRFLRSQAAAIADVVNSGALTAGDQAQAVHALAELYALGGDAGAQPAGDPIPIAAPPGAAAPAPEPPVAVDPRAADAGPLDSMPDPSLSNLGLNGIGAPLGAPMDPLSSLASAFPGALGSFPPPIGAAAGSPLDSIGGLAGLAPLAGLASQIGDQASHYNSGRDAKSDAKDDSASKDQPNDDGRGVKDAGGSTMSPSPPPEDQTLTAPTEPAPAATSPAGGAPPAGPPPAATTVQLPDGSTANASTPAAAQAMRAYLTGTPLDAAYRQAGIDLPPPGTPVTAPIDPSQLAAGDVGMFKDHYVAALGAGKAVKDGQVMPLSSVASSPDFLGWLRPSAPASLDPVAVSAPAPTAPS